jgi:hypothetical protein
MTQAKKPKIKKDEYGFRKGSKASSIYTMLLTGKNTKKQVLAKLNKKYPGSNNKVTLNAFLSDVQRPVGTYPASRGITIEQDDKGILSIKGGD